MALEDPEYRALSVDYLVQLYIKIGDFSQARKILTKYAEERNMLSWAKLENIELNYQTSKKYYQKINDNDLEQRKKLALARIEFQLGNYKQGRELLNALKYDKKYTVQSLFEECISYMIEHNYEKGYKTLKLIKTNNFKPNQAKDYEAMNFYFSYFLG